MDRSARIDVGVERFPALTPTLPPATHTNSYALGTKQVLLVEPATPYEEERRAWVEWARGIASTGRELLGIFVTHHHADHVGGASFFADALGLPIWAHAETAARLDTPVARLLDEGSEILLDGPTPERWRAMFTPGHAPGHVCLLRDDGVVIVGDMVASVGTILIAPGEGDMIRYLAELRRLEALDARVALPAHGDPIDQPSRLFRAYVAHRLMREALIEKAVTSTGGGTLDDLVPVAYADTKPEIWPIARLALAAHLEKLVIDGAVLQDGDRWTPRA